MSNNSTGSSAGPLSPAVRSLAEKALAKLAVTHLGHAFGSRRGIVVGVPLPKGILVAFRRVAGKIRLEVWDGSWVTPRAYHELPADLRARAAAMLDAPDASARPRPGFQLPLLDLRAFRAR